MPWGRLDDNSAGNGKLIALSDAAYRMWAMGLIYCQRNLTDGFIPEHAIDTFGVRAQNKRRIADELCSPQMAGRSPLWSKVEGGYQIHDYLEWNDSKADIEKARGKARGRWVKWRSTDKSTNGVDNGVDSGVSNGVDNAVPMVRGTGTKEKEEKDRDVQRARFEAFMSAFPRKEGAGAAWKQWQLMNPDEAFSAQISAGAHRYAASKAVQRLIADGDEKFIRMAKNWLADEGWQDEPAPVAESPKRCRYGHSPVCIDDAACTSRYLAELRSPAAVAS